MSSLTTENALRQQLRQHRQQLDLLTNTFTAADLRLVLVDSLQKLDAISPPEKVDEGETKTSNVGSNAGGPQPKTKMEVPAPTKDGCKNPCDDRESQVHRYHSSTLRPTQKPHNKKFPMVTQTRVDSVDDYYQPCILTETKGKGKRQLVDCAVSEAPEKAILGKGQFGTVVRCQNKEHKYMCALKAIQKKFFNSTIETLQNEVKQLQKLTGHPSIVALYEVLETSTHLYFATEVRCFL